MLLICLINFTKTALNAESIPKDWTGIRSSGMGDAFTATANDETAVFSNPAGLSATRNPATKRFVHDIMFPDIEVGGNPQMLSNMQANPSQWGENLINSAKNNPGTQSYLLFQSFPEIILGAKNAATFLIGFPIRSENKMAFLDTSNPNSAYAVSTTTVGAALGVAGSSQRGFFAMEFQCAQIIELITKIQLMTAQIRPLPMIL